MNNNYLQLGTVTSELFETAYVQNRDILRGFQVAWCLRENLVSAHHKRFIEKIQYMFCFSFKRL